MSSTKIIKLIVLGAFAVLFAVCVSSSTFLSTARLVAANEAQTPESGIPAGQDDFVGSETCRACHEPQFNKVANTKHGQLGTLDSWKGKVVGCESCHGPGREHVEGNGDKTKIKVFKEMDPKAVSESCLACHAGKENHNNFRRGEHWRNNVGCTDCHSAHGNEDSTVRAGSIEYVNDTRRQMPNRASSAMLKVGEPQLCLSCHNETKAQFSKPFHHKVLEGTMTCSDCHNAHGGFETKQTKLAVGLDASCIKCHSNKQGPFVFEHAPMKLEGCASCHTPHGSQNPKLLKRSSVRQLCIECHTSILTVGLPDPDDDNPGGPHGQTAIRSQNCTICHAAIHGSNAHPALFR